MKKILLIGGSGFVGKHLKNELIGSYEVISTGKELNINVDMVEVHSGGDSGDNQEKLVVNSYDSVKKLKNEEKEDGANVTNKNINVDCVQIPWVMMSCNNIETTPASILETNTYRWNHNKKHPHKIRKFRCRYDNIEVKCIFKTNKFNSLFKLKKKPIFSFYQKDLSIKNSLSNFKNIDIIIHCASITDAANSFGIKKLMYKNNLGCMKTVLDYCIKNKTKLIHISTTSVYGKQANIVSENDYNLINPQSPYADIKLIEEKLLQKNTNKIKFNSFRFGTIAGVSKGMRFHTAINKFCLNAALNKAIAVYQTAYNQYRPYLSLRDSFKVFKFCIENNRGWIQDCKRGPVTDRDR